MFKMSIVSTTKMTARQFLQLGEDPAGVRLELVNGEVAGSPSATPDHSNVDRMLTHILMAHILPRKLGKLYGDVDTIFDKHDVRRPDIMFYQTARLHLVGKQAMEGPPDLCIEIVSPSSQLIDRRDKFQQYAAGKVAFYWIVDPSERTLEGFKLVRKNYQLASKGKNSDVIALPPFPELQIPLKDLWPS